MGPVKVAHSQCGFNSSPKRDSGDYGPLSVNKESTTEKKTEIAKATILQFSRTACDIDWHKMNVAHRSARSTTIVNVVSNTIFWTFDLD